MNDHNFDLNAYLQRIRYNSTPTADLKTLRAIQRLHPQAIAFENFNPLLGLPVKIDIQSLQQKLIYNRRGGYCFEHNLLLYHALNEIGFDVTKLGGRVLHNKPDDAITSRTHMLLLIKLDGEKYIADVGFGGSTPTAPLLLETDIVQQTPHEPYRLQEREDHFLLQTYIKSEWKTVHRFTLQPQYFIDYKVANWYTSTHPNSHFVTDLSLAITAPGRRYHLSNNKFSIHDQQEGTTKKWFTDAGELYKLIEETFKLDLSDLPKPKKLLKRQIQKQPQ